ncbi:MAG: recombinase family protein [Planctomycetes bacterium]|nr:recombinase family protein [Planctomycetota bacterium]
MNKQIIKSKIRCAIYTRKSVEEGLEQEFNTLDAQRECAENFIASQKAEGWEIVSERYDDGGFTGSNIERPAMQRLLHDIESERIDCVVVYKVDRLSRSLLDFATLLGGFDEHNVDFVSVTQQFNTATSMGRLILNILLSFAQFERDMISERTRDKMAGMRRKGKWTGGKPIIGYDIDYERKRLVVNADEAQTVSRIYKRYHQTYSPLLIAEELNADNITTKSLTSQAGKHRPGHTWDSKDVYRVLKNRLYRGDLVFKGEIYEGDHAPIITAAEWERAQDHMKQHKPKNTKAIRVQDLGFLHGLIECGGCGRPMVATHSTKNKVKYRYYRCSKAAKKGVVACDMGPVPAGDLEQNVCNYLKKIFQDPEIVLRTMEVIECADESLHRSGMAAALNDMDAIWGELYPAERHRIASLMIEKLVVRADALSLHIQVDACVGLIEGENAGDTSVTAGSCAIVSLPLETRRRCGQSRLVFEENKDASMTPVLVSIAKGRRWLEELESGGSGLVSDLAEKYQVDRSYMRKHLNLALLPPSQIEMILNESINVSVKGLFADRSGLW